MAERFTAMDINIRVGQAEAACQLVQGVDAAQAQTTQRLAQVAQQIAGLEYKTAASLQVSGFMPWNPGAEVT